MHVGIIVYSQTGHTLSVARKLKERLSAAGHTVALEQLKTTGPMSLSAESVDLDRIPEVAPYEALVFGSPVWGGSPAAPMVSYLEQVGSLEGKQVGCLVTGFFPAAWGCNQAMARMSEICTSKGATFRGGGSVGWFSLRRRRQIEEAVNRLSDCFEHPQPGAPPARPTRAGSSSFTR